MSFRAFTRAIAVAAALFTAASASAANRTRPLASDYDVVATSYTYCLTAGTATGTSSTTNSPDFWGDGLPLDLTTTSGSSTTVTSVSSNAAFTAAAVGDELIWNLDGTRTSRYITAKASADSITVNAAVNLGGGRAANYTPFLRRRTCGTAATNGWFPVRGLTSFAISVAVDQFNATSITANIECRLEGSVSSAITVTNKVYTATGGDIFSFATSGGVQYDSCRVGLKVNTASAAQKVTVQVGG